MSGKDNPNLLSLAGDFISDLSFRDLPQAAVSMVCNGLTDLAAVTILGEADPATQAARQIVCSSDSRHAARICFSRRSCPSLDAAFINGTSGHANDYDDTGIGVHPAHPSVVLGSAIFAEGEAIGADGQALIGAYVAGYEVWGDFARRDAKPHHLKGFHPTSTFGTIAAAAAVANLYGLDSYRAGHAIGIAASLASGLIGNFGSMTKPVHAGFAARNGIFAARLAKAGVTAAPDIIDSRAGFLKTFSVDGEVDLHDPPIYRREWWILRHGLNFKLYPVCYSGHRAVDGILDLQKELCFHPDDVLEVRVGLTQAQIANLFSHEPNSALEAKFSIEFMMAAAIIAGRISFDELSPAMLQRSDVRQLSSKVQISPCSSLGEDTIELALKGGRRIIRPLSHPRGHSSKPLDPQVLWRKFSDCTKDRLEMTKARLLFDRLQKLDQLSSLKELPYTEEERLQATPARGGSGVEF